MKQAIDAKQLSQPQLRRLQETDRPPVEFWIDGQICQALSGDTVLTAILTNQGAIRRTEFSRQKRAGFCLMGACQDCWIRLESGERLRACSTMLVPGMRLATDLNGKTQHE